MRRAVEALTTPLATVLFAVVSYKLSGLIARLIWRLWQLPEDLICE